MNQQTLCQQYGTATPNIQILTNSSSGGWVGGWSNNVIYINATFTVNTGFSITGCVLRFGPSGSIVVTNNGSLNSSNSFYFGCSGWPGLTLNGTGSLTLTNNKFEDASYALTIASSTSTATITSNSFNRNIMDIYVPPGVAANALISNNVLDCTSNTVAGARSDIGILANKATLSFGIPLAPLNIVRNHRLGAGSYSSTLNIRNAEFACNDELAIQSSLGTLDIRTDPSFSFTNYFFHNKSDIYTDRTDFNLFASNFSECLQDNVISVNNVYAEHIDIQANNFMINDDNTFALSNHKTGIGIDRSSGAVGSGYLNNIQGNNFHILPFTIDQGRTAIRATGLPGTWDIMHIFYNTINVDEGGSNPGVAHASPLVEVVINTAEGFVLKQNTLNTKNIDDIDHRSRWGFYLHGWLSPSSHNGFHQNQVFGQSTAPDYGMCAYHFDQIGPWEICDNLSDYTLRGFHIRGVCNPSIFGGNVMGDHRRSPSSGTGATAALILEPHTTIGKQFCRHNLFTYGNYSPDNGAEHRDPSFAVILQSRFDVSPYVAQEMPNPVFPSSGWFFLNDSCRDTPNTHCGGTHEGGEYEESFSEYEWAIIENNLTYTPSVDAEEWDRRRQMMAKLLRYPVLRIAYPNANIFYEAQLNNSPGLFAQWSEQLEQTMLIPSDYFNALENYRAYLAGLLLELDEHDAILASLEDVEHADADFFSSRAIILNQINYITQQLNELRDVIETARIEPLAACAEALNGLPQDSEFESNQVFLNGLSLKKARREGFSDDDYSLLRIIATECPEEAGSTREQALNWLPIGDYGRKIWEDGEAPGCNAVERPGLRSFDEKAQYITLWPNPTSTALSVQFAHPFTGQISVSAIIGNNVLLTYQQAGETSRVNLPVQTLSPGVYLLKAVTSDGKLMTQKFIVTK